MNTIASLNNTLSDRYSVEREVGRGGMATVFLARDRKHDRPVALKLLNPELGAVLGVERFLSEIRVTANLQHPNLLPLFDSGEANGLLYYVMPFVEGESLRARITRDKQLPIDEAVRIAVAIGSALDYAHRHGVIHRDLKPENILLHEGQPLVADFGIALAVSNAGGTRVTQSGLSLGTPQYMSPEQATGDRAIDGRTDVYSLAAVLYEMLAGEPPHTGTTAQAIIARLLTDRPRALHESRASVPEHVEWAVAKGLEKVPADRFATAKEFIAALASHSVYQRTLGTRSARSKGERRRTSTRTRVAQIVAGMAFLTVGVFLAFAYWNRSGRNDDSIALLVEAPDIDGTRGQFFGAVRMSPDGKSVAFVVTNDTLSRIFVRHLSDVTSHAVAGTDDAFDLFFSPDSRTIGFFTSGGQLRRVPTDGGATTTLGDVPNFFTGASWGTRGDQPIVIGTQSSNGALLQMSSTGGPMTPLTKARGTLHALPFLHPDGETILFVNWGPGNTEDDFLAIGSRTTGQYNTTNLLIAQPIGVIDNYAIVLTANGAIKAAPFDVRTHELTGHAVVIDENTVLPPMGPVITDAALSPSGALAYLTGSIDNRLVLSDSGNARTLLSDSRTMTHASLSPDGRHIATALLSMRGDTAVSDIYVLDVASHTLSRLTNLGNADQPAWTFDGSAIVYHTWFQSHPTVWKQPMDGSAPAKLLELPSASDLIEVALPTPDNRHLVVLRDSIISGNARLFLYSFDDRDKPTRIARETANIFSPALSPDGHWVAYATSETAGGTPRVFVTAIDGSARAVQISPEFSERPIWSHDGQRLFYQTPRGVEAATLRRAGTVVEVSSRTLAFRNSRSAPLQDVSADGKHILTVQQARDGIRLAVVTNWVKHARERIAESKIAK